MVSIITLLFPAQSFAAFEDGGSLVIIIFGGFIILLIALSLFIIFLIKKFSKKEEIVIPETHKTIRDTIHSILTLLATIFLTLLAIIYYPDITGDHAEHLILTGLDFLINLIITHLILGKIIAYKLRNAIILGFIVMLSWGGIFGLMLYNSPL